MPKITMNGNQNDRTFEDFLLYCNIQNLTEDTIRDYKDNWRMFMNFCNGREITQDILDEYVLSCKARKLSPNSINTYIRHLKAIFRYLRLDIKITFLKVTFENINPYSNDDIKIMLQKPDIKRTTFPYYRNWVIINTFLATAVRAKSLINIKIKDVDLTDGFISISHLKNRKTVRLPIPPTLSQILREYLDIRGGKKEDYLFCTQEGEKFNTNSLGHSIYKHLKSLGIEDTGLHRFRHTFAKQFIKNNGSILDLQHYLTHSSIEQTRKYVQRLDIDVKVSSLDINPLETFTEKKIKINKKE